MIPEVQQFAPGKNQAALLKPFYLLSRPLFQDYTREIRQRWQGFIGVQLNGARQDSSWGKASVVITFGKITRAELAYLVSLKGPCTLRCRNEDTNLFGNFNATLRQTTAGTLSKSGDMYESAEATFIDLVAL